MTVVELFAGGGGASVGLAAAGFSSVLGVEWDESAVQVAQAMGHPTIQGDVRDLSLYEDVEADAVWSSFPCQAFSTAGKRKGAEDERNGWPWTVAVLDKVGPRWFMGENVPGLTMHSGEHCGDPQRCPGCYFRRVILPQLEERFPWVGWAISNASSWGTPQHRRRLFIVAGPRPVRWPAPTHADPAKCLGLFATLTPWTTAGEALGLTGRLGGSSSSSHHPDQERPANITAEPAPAVGGRGNQMLMTNGQKTAQSPRPGKGPDGKRPAGRLVEKTNTLDVPAMTVPAAGPGLALVGGGTNPHTPGQAHERTHRDLTEEPCTTLPAPQVGNAGPWVLERDAPAVTAQEVKGTRASEKSGGTFNGGPDRASDALYMATGRRRLTVSECRVLMGWPEEYDEHLATVTKTAAYRILGNGCVPVWVEVHARAVLEALIG